ncbi:hypothetical protein BAUCODRAFT_149228 [Baudoinia panamericana UAMH 10762]|uniref:RNA polymerase I-specific transcription initiation factor RRN3 n=1 Tax=Baudoinia panamericana (strain UAMH 10762) TaxID=717646 RepID=M2N7Z8_BAUPA|nr:uncharacterized protein BAUCODRAFT_149228 [Baudoinia panamericana UAMH 10762]EMC95214.1 hypothetical protein BAUCODRAFT_149228 [Baudoinia panamericana UAMH 10762]
MLPPPTALSKRPTVGLKRDSSYLDTDDEANLSLSTKKLKVAFDPNVDVRLVDDWSEKSFELVKEEVRLGIERHLAPGDRRDDTQYIKLLTLFDHDEDAEEAPSGKLLKKYMLAIDARVSSLGECGKLVSAVLNMSWLGRDDVFAGLFIRFLTTLATAHAKFIPSIMEKLVAHFARLPASHGRLPGETPVPRSTMFTRVHAAIRTLLRQVPSAMAAFTRVLRSEFPNDLATKHSYIQYQTHLLRVGGYMPQLESEVLAILTQRLVSIDVQIQIDIDEFEEEAEDKLLQPSFESRSTRTAADDSEDSDDDSVSESEETMAEDEQRLKEIKLKIDKMDFTMDLLFEHYASLMKNGLRVEFNEAYQQLLSHFTTFIFPNRTRHAQFLVFHFSQALPEYASFFARQCLHALGEINRSISQRLHACAYLASFVARGVHIPASMVQEIFGQLCRELDLMRKRHEPGCRGPDRRAYSVYYAVAQAILYVFCFRWQDLALRVETPEPGDEDASIEDLLAEGRELAWLPGIKETMEKNIHSPLNPLKVCSPVIVGEFAKLAHHVRFMYVFTKLESNKRVRLGNTSRGYAVDNSRRETAIDRKAGEAHLQLEAYFPFDPYRLPLSQKWIKEDYREWSLPAGMRQDANESEAEDESDEESLLDELEADELPAADVVSVSS